MRAKVKRDSAETAILRVLDALAREVIEASDEEVTAAAADLRMDLNSRDSAAFAGLTYFARPTLSDFFDIEPQAPAERAVGDPPAAVPRSRQRRSKHGRIPAERKPSDGK